MTANGWFQVFFFFALVLVCAKPLGVYMARVFERERTWADVIFRPLERLVYRLTGIDETHEMAWTEYAVVMLLFSLVSMLATYAVERLQQWLPLNPQHLASVAPDLALNTAASFTTNTNWQSYVPETTMSYLTQMLTLAYHNFFSAAVGMALAVALIRGISRRESKTLGNFWVDATRASLWVLLPGCLNLCASVGLARRSAELSSLRSGKARASAEDDCDRLRWQDDDTNCSDAEHCAGPGCFSGSDQDARDKWGRVL